MYLGKVLIGRRSYTEVHVFGCGSRERDSDVPSNIMNRGALSEKDFRNLAADLSVISKNSLRKSAYNESDVRRPRLDVYVISYEPNYNNESEDDFRHYQQRFNGLIVSIRHCKSREITSKIPFILEQLSKTPRKLPFLEIKKEIPLLDAIEMPVGEYAKVKNYDPHKWNSKANMAA